MKHLYVFILISIISTLYIACAPIYVKNFKYETYVRENNFAKADAFLTESSFFNRNRNKLLFLLEKGKIAHLKEDYSSSNNFFNEADLMIEDLRFDFGAEAISLLTNDQMKPYQPEDYETVAIHYYKALNYLNLNLPNEALVEAKRINLKLNKINDKYADHKNRYQNDALAHIVMGMIYERQRDYNDAFIAYRNAYELFEKNDNSYMGSPLPAQLKEDLMRAAHLSGFTSDLQFYERKFGTTYKHTRAPGGYLYFFWENGLGPVKSEWSLNFSIVPIQGTQYQFVNHDLGLSFPFEYENDDDDDDGPKIEDIQFVRVAFPMYVDRPYNCTSGSLVAGSERTKLNPVENYDYIARRTLKDRFAREAARALLRLALKKLSELGVRKEDETAGAILGVFNAITEKADTRNWQTLPSTISYVRIPLKRGSNTIFLEASAPNGGTIAEEFTVEGTGKTQYISRQTFATLGNISANAYYRQLQVSGNPFSGMD